MRPEDLYPSSAMIKNVLIGILLLSTLVFGSLYLNQNQKKAEAEAKAANLHEKLAEVENRVVQQEERTATLQTRLHDTRAKAVAKAEQVSRLEQVITNTAQTNAQSASPMAEMFKSPEMRELSKNQQKMA